RGVRQPRGLQRGPRAVDRERQASRIRLGLGVDALDGRLTLAGLGWRILAGSALEAPKMLGHLRRGGGGVWWGAHRQTRVLLLLLLLLGLRRRLLRLRLGRRLGLIVAATAAQEGSVEGLGRRRSFKGRGPRAVRRVCRSVLGRRGRLAGIYASYGRVGRRFIVRREAPGPPVSLEIAVVGGSVHRARRRDRPLPRDGRS